MIASKSCVLILLFLLLGFGCGQANDNKISIKSDITKNNIYSIDVTALCRYDLYINDIPAVINSNAGGDYFDINDYVLENGKYKVKAVFYTNPDENALINQTKLTLYSSLKNDGEKLGKLKELQNLSVPDLKSIKPTIIKQEWEIVTTDLPYKLEGWKNSEVFNEEDSAMIKEKVTAYYEKLRILLNEGNGEAYVKYFKNSDSEMVKYDFIKEEGLAEANRELIKGINYTAKNNMLPLEDYSLKIYAQGRLICLERIGNIKVATIDKKYQTPGELADGVNKPKQLDTRGWSPLIVNAPTYINNFKFYLHIPQGSDQFEIIR